LAPSQRSRLLKSDLHLIHQFEDSNPRILLLLPYSHYPHPSLKSCLSSFTTITQLLSDLNQSRSVRSSALFLQDLYGPGIPLSSTHPLSQIFRLVSQTSPLALPGASQIQLSPLFITDALKAVLKVTFSHSRTNQYHFSGSQSLTPLSLTHLLGKIFGQSFQVQSSPLPQSASSFPQKLPSTPSWFRPSTTLQFGLRQTIHWIKPDFGSAKFDSYLPLPIPALGMLPHSSRSLLGIISKLFSPLSRFISWSRGLLRFLVLSFLSFFTSLRFLPQPSSPLHAPESHYPSLPSYQSLTSTSSRSFFGIIPRLSFRLALSFLLIIIAVSVSLLGFMTYQAQIHLSHSYQSLSSGDFPQASKSSLEAENYLQTLELPARVFDPAFTLIFHRSLISYHQAALQSTVTIRQLASTGQLLRQFILDASLPDSQAHPLDLFPQVHTALNTSLQSLSLLQATLPPLTPPFTSQSRWDYFRTRLSSTRDQAYLAQDLLSFYPSLSGVNRPQIYLILLQNNRELRPTGGFIGSFLLATLNQGQLTDLQLYDVYSADGQLQGHVEPPEPIRQYLGEANWFLRDANWDPDFPTSASQIAWFLDKELHTQVDGVLALDVTFLESLLQLTGPLNLPDYQDQVTADNLYLLAQQRVEKDFFPGSHAKKNYLSALSSTLIHKIQSDSQISWTSLFSAIHQGLEQKHLLISVFDPQLSYRLARLNWDGSLPTLASTYSPSSQVLGTTSAQISDHLMLVEANLGVNKVNYFISRQLSHTIDLTSESGVGETLTLHYQNSSPSSESSTDTHSTLAGPYKNYLRLYLPLHSQISAISVQNPQTQQTQLLDLADLDSSVEHSRQVYGFYFIIPPQSKRLVQITYQLPVSALQSFNIPSSSLTTLDNPSDSSPSTDSHPESHPSSDLTYQFSFTKQPGTLADPYQLTIIYPDSLVPTSSSPQLEFPSSSPLTDEGKLTYNTTLSTDLHISVNFTSRD
jgi:hypothetical protein